MKKLLLLLLVVNAVAFSQTTYTWNVASGAWTTAGNWNPTRTTPAADDILIFDGAVQATPIVTAVPTQTVGQMIFQNSVNTRLITTVAATVTIGGGTGTDFDVQAGSTCRLDSTTAIKISLNTATTGSIAGTFTASSAGSASVAHQLLATDASSIIVSSTGSVIQGIGTGTTFTGSIFGTTGTAGVIVFQNGSTFIQRAGSNPFGLAQPNSKVTFNSGSNFKFYLSGSPALTGRTFGNFIVGNGANCNPTVALSADCIIYDLIQESGAAIAWAITTTGNGGILHIKGNITQSGTFAFSLANNTKATSSIVFDGGTTQTISGSGSNTTTFKTRTRVASGTTLVVSRNIVADSLFQVDGALSVDASNSVNNGTVGNFVLSSGATLKSASTAGITSSGATGNIQTSTRTFSTTANYEYNGSSAQVTGSGLPATVANLNVNNSAGVSLTGSASVTGTLTLSSGNLSLGANNLTLAAAVAGTPSDSKHIVTDGAGKVVKNITTSGSFTYPVGYDASTYNPVTVALDGASTADDFSVKVSSGVSPAAPDNATAAAATWDISEGTGGGSNATLTFQWTGAQEGGSFNRGTAAVWHHNGSNWVNVSGGTTSGSDPYTLSTTSTVSSFSPFIVGNDGALPVEISSFTATVKGKNVELKWNTATETNNHGFEVERSVNNVWTKVGFVEGAGTSNITKQYGYVDAVSANGKYSYRLKQIDNNGAFKYASTIEANVSFTPEQYSLSQNYPNPFNPSSTINFSVKTMEHASMKIYDITGREVATLFNDIAQPGQLYTVQFNASQLASGVYFYVLNTKNFREVKKMQLLK